MKITISIFIENLMHKLIIVQFLEWLNEELGKHCLPTKTMIKLGKIVKINPLGNLEM